MENVQRSSSNIVSITKKLVLQAFLVSSCVSNRQAKQAIWKLPHRMFVVVSGSMLTPIFLTSEAEIFASYVYVYPTPY